jgi:hypothetical protein
MAAIPVRRPDMGSRGPIGKPADERRRRNKPSTATTAITRTGPIEIPTANRKWHKIAIQWYEGLEESGQSDLYEPSDWAMAYILAESISRDLRPKPVGIHPQTGKVMRAQMPLAGTALSAYLKGMTALLTTIGDRRRAGVEIQRGAAVETVSDNVAAMDDYRNMLGG